MHGLAQAGPRRIPNLLVAKFVGNKARSLHRCFPHSVAELHEVLHSFAFFRGNSSLSQRLHRRAPLLLDVASSVAYRSQQNLVMNSEITIEYCTA
jgi:hypothetical protein